MTEKSDPHPGCETYSIPDLHHLSQTSKILFRIHDPLSSSPLFWTGNPSTSGFAAPNLNLGILTPSAYSKVYTEFNPALITDKTEYEGWAAGKYIRHTILDHVMGKEKQTCLSIADLSPASFPASLRRNSHLCPRSSTLQFSHLSPLLIACQAAVSSPEIWD